MIYPVHVGQILSFKTCSFEFKQVF